MAKMSKTPDEIKEGLECHSLVAGGCAVCSYGGLEDGDCSGILVRDALAYIQQLEAANAELLTKVEQLEARREGEMTMSITNHDSAVILSLLADQETLRARMEHGEAYASHEEGFGVLYEEVLESEDELTHIRHYMDHLSRYIRCGDTSGMVDVLKAISTTAIRAAEEAVQVAAVCQKWMEGLPCDTKGV